LNKTERQQCAEERARLELGLAPDAPFSAEETSVALKYAIIGKNGHAAPLGAEQFNALCTEWDWSSTTDGDSVLYALEHCPDYGRRLGEIVIEARMSQRLAPELCIAPRPLADTQLRALLPATHNHAVLFAAAPLFTHEFYPLAVDAFSCDSARQGRAFFNVLGVHIDWIDSAGRARRVIALDMEHNQLIEMPLQHPLPINSVHFLCLGADERALHQQWSTRFSVPQINPAATATLSDDKGATTKAWSDMGLETPSFIRVGPRDTRPAARFMDTYGEVVIKPNSASEGRGVAYLQNPADFAAYWHTTDPAQNTLLQARRDRVFFKDPQTQAVHTLALRLNVGSDGAHRRVDSGYAQLGANTHSPASRGHDGAIIALSALQNDLVYQQGDQWQSLRLDINFWRETFIRAERGAALFADLLLVGIDLVVDIDVNGQVSALLIEANPRPAGLCHARLLCDGRGADQAGVGETMWMGLRSQLEQPTARAV